MAKVVFRPSGKTIECEVGDNLLEVARRADVYIEAPCNGSKSCGKCKVKLLNGEVKQEISSHLTDEDKANGYILACCSTIISDIEVLTNSSLDMAMRGMKVEGGDTAKDKALFDRAVEIAQTHDLTLETNIKKTCITLDEPTLDDNISDVDRLERHISMNFGKEMTYDIEVLKKMPKAFRENNFEITITYRDFDDRLEIIDVEPGNTEGELYGLAIDIGTTSVVVCLVNMITNEVVEKGASGNGQLQFGADVINRIIYAIKKNNIEKAKAAIVDDTLNMLINELLKESGVKRNNIVSVVASGNTTMATLFLGIYPDFLRLEPFIPPFFKSPKLTAKEVGLDINPSAGVYLSPNVASYVGGDITAGVLAAGIWANEENVLFIDLGTNGEIVFGNQDFMMSCACSAGPAFEGGGISCGMRASAGAIDSVDIDPETLVPTLRTIDNEPAIGICGSGIIDLICEMLKENIIDRRGKIHRDLQNERIRFDENDIGEYVLAFEKDNEHLSSDLFITEVDIDNFIRTKGAIYSGAATLIESLGMDFDCVDKVYIAGGIGNHLNIENSVFIGLLPDIDRDKFQYIGNSSLIGSYLTLLSDEARAKLEEIASIMTYIELSVYPTYMDEFVSCCFLPHTNIDAFPSVKAILEG
ncbi:MAG: corrinoid activation/regeneration protein AcsV [Intestinibacter sp.]|uniref:corrinoid activation/regeneration protein AcsV n=1 Tax=Intestinibacter sp. TaxID=1965304 RepID=UPI003F174591